MAKTEEQLRATGSSSQPQPKKSGSGLNPFTLISDVWHAGTVAVKDVYNADRRFYGGVVSAGETVGKDVVHFGENVATAEIRLVDPSFNTKGPVPKSIEKKIAKAGATAGKSGNVSTAQNSPVINTTVSATAKPTTSAPVKSTTPAKSTTAGNTTLSSGNLTNQGNGVLGGVIGAGQLDAYAQGQQTQAAADAAQASSAGAASAGATSSGGGLAGITSSPLLKYAIAAAVIGGGVYYYRQRNG
jgi:hypothetical protein